VVQYNLVGPHASRRDYLSVGETELTVVHWVRERGCDV
jgi:hypothetical protein